MRRKASSGGGKLGVSFVKTEDEFQEAVEYATAAGSDKILVEEYAEGHEVSVETISFHGNHTVIQITDKESSGPPHFVELAHHQPSILPMQLQDKIRSVVPRLLDTLNYMNGAAHIEMKITEDGKLYLIEMNPRGGGDHIADTLVELSTGYDYIKGMIDVAIDNFQEPSIHHVACSGIYFLCQQTAHLMPFFKKAEAPWLVEKAVESYELVNSTGNYNRNGYLIYRSNHRVML